MSTPAGFGGPHCSEGRSHHTHPTLLWCLLPCSHTAHGEKGCREGPPSQSCNASQAHIKPLAAVLPPLVWLHNPISANSVLPSLHPPYLLLNIYNVPVLLSSTQLPARESLAAKARHALGRHGQISGWEKMASAGIILLCCVLTSL